VGEDGSEPAGGGPARPSESAASVLSDPTARANQRPRAAFALREEPGAETERTLIQALRDSDQSGHTRSTALDVLSELGELPEAGLLVSVLEHDSSRHVRGRAGVALGQASDTDAAAALWKAAGRARNLSWRGRIRRAARELESRADPS
jgi:HEAT repeat protein